MSDAALVLRARGGDELAFRRLLDKSRLDIENIVSLYFLPGGDRGDLRQEALFGFHKAVQDYKASSGIMFRTFARLCVSRQVITAVKTATRSKHRPLNGSVSFSTPVTAGKDVVELGDTIASRGPGPLETLAQREDLEAVERVLDQGLSTFEHEVAMGIAVGLTYEEIADRAEVDVKSVDNALQRAKRKIGAGLQAVAA